MKIIQLPIADCRLPICGKIGPQGFASIGNRKLAIANAFTLIELILAIGVSAIVLIAINAVFFSALRLRNAATEAVDEATPIENAVTTMRRDLMCAVAPIPGGIMTGDFKAGDVNSIGVNDMVNLEVFTATGALNADPAAPWGDIQRVTYGLKTPVPPNGTSKDLVRTVARNLLSSGTPEVDEQWMLSGVESMQVQCFDGAQWYDQWDTTSIGSVNTNLPTAVRITLQLSANGGNTRPQPIMMLVPIDSQSRTNY
jgi:type II secretion system protein J